MTHFLKPYQIVVLATCGVQFLLTAPATFAQTTIEATITISEAQRQVSAALAASSATLEATKSYGGNWVMRPEKAAYRGGC